MRSGRDNSHFVDAMSWVGISACHLPSIVMVRSSSLNSNSINWILLLFAFSMKVYSLPLVLYDVWGQRCIVWVDVSRVLLSGMEVVAIFQYLSLGPHVG